MSTSVLAPVTDAGAAIARQASNDQYVVELWLHGRSPHTQRAYRADVARFLAFVATSLPTVTLGDLQAFADALAQQDLAPSSRVRTLAAIKSLLAFGQRTGYLPLNVGAALKLPPKKDRLAERILSETRSIGSSPWSRVSATRCSCACCTPAACGSRAGGAPMARSPAAGRCRPGRHLRQGRQDPRGALAHLGVAGARRPRPWPSRGTRVPLPPRWSS